MRELVRREGGLFIPDHDYVSNTYTGTNLTQVEYRRGGATGEIVATLTMTYNVNDDIETVTKS